MTTQDVIVKKNELRVSESFLLAHCKGLTKNYLDRFNNGNKDSKLWEREKFKGGFYYKFKSIPNRSPQYYQSQLPTEEKLREMANSRKGVFNESIKKGFEKALNEDYARFMPLYAETPNQQRNLAKTASIMEVIVNYLVSNNIPKRQYLNVCTECGRIIEAMGLKGLYMPTNARRLQDKVLVLLGADAQTDETDLVNTPQRTIKDLVKVVYLPRVHNKNALKFDKEVLAWTMILRGCGLNLTVAMIARKVQFLCEIHDKGVPSDGWFETQLAGWEVKQVTANMRYSNGSHLRRYQGYIPKLRPAFAGDCWQVDGTRFNVIAWREKIEVIDKEGNRKSKFIEKFFKMVAVRDVYSGYVLGWAFGLEENRWMYAQALKMAYENAGHMPCEIVFDRFPGHNTPQWEETIKRLEKAGVIIHITSEASGKAEIERWIGTLQTVFEMESMFYYGEGIKSRRAYAHRHPDYMTKLKKQAHSDGWNADAAFREAENIMEAYNHTPLSYYSTKYAKVDKSPAQLYAESEKPTIIIGVQPVINLAVNEVKPHIQIYEDQINTKINGVEYCYAVELPEVWLNHPKVMMAYDPQNLETVWLYDVNTEKYLGEAHLIELGQRYGKVRDYAPYQARKAQLQANKKIKAARFLELTEAGQGVNEETLLQVGRIPKTLSDAAESHYLLGSNDDTNEPIIITAVKDNKPVAMDEDDIDLDALVRGQY